MSYPLVPPFSVKASYQNSQYANNPYTNGSSQVFGHLVNPPATGVEGETWSNNNAVAVAFTGYSATSEVQTLTVTGAPTGGTFSLVWGDAVTSSLAINSSAATVQSALNGLASVPAATGGVNDVQTVTISGTPTGGTFTLSFGGQTTSALAYNASSSAVQTAFLALSSVGTGNAKVTGSAGGPYTVTFSGTLGNASRAVITAASSLTGGTSPAVAVAHTTTGVAATPNITVTGSNGGPWTVTFGNLLANENVALIAADNTNLTGGTNPAVTVTGTVGGQGSFVNDALLNQTRQWDGLNNFYDSGSGNHF